MVFSSWFNNVKTLFYIEPKLSFYIKKNKNNFDYIKLDLIFKSLSLTLDFAGRLSVQYTLNTLYNKFW